MMAHTMNLTTCSECTKLCCWLIFMQAQNPVREDMKQEMMVCALQCIVRFPSIERSNIHSLITSTLTAVFEWTMTQHNIALVIVL